MSRPVQRHKIDRSRTAKRDCVPGTEDWVHDVVRDACPTAIAFHVVTSMGKADVMAELASGSDARLAASALLKALNTTAPCVYSFSVHAFITAGPCNRCGTDVGEPHQNDCASRCPGCGRVPNLPHAAGCSRAQWTRAALPGYAPGSAEFPKPVAQQMNELQDIANAEINRLQGELDKAHKVMCEGMLLDSEETLRQKVLELQDAYERAQDTNEAWAPERARFAASIARVGDLERALHDQARFLAGLDERRWSKPEQEQRRVLLAKANKLLRPRGADADHHGAIDSQVRRDVRKALEPMKGKTIEQVGGAKAIAESVAKAINGVCDYAMLCDDILSRDKIAQKLITERIRFIPRDELLRLDELATRNADPKDES